NVRGLNYHKPRFVPSSRPATHLGDHLKGSFEGPKVRKIKHPVCIYNSHQTDAVKVKTFADHLRTDQNIDISLFKIIDNGLIAILSSSSVKIHPLNFCLGK